eukprot:8040766-Pyramimonas_sp.AAC.1
MKPPLGVGAAEMRRRQAARNKLEAVVMFEDGPEVPSCIWEGNRHDGMILVSNEQNGSELAIEQGGKVAALMPT